MTKKLVAALVSVAAGVSGLAVAGTVLYRKAESARAADSAEAPPNRPAPATSAAVETDEGPACTLDPAARARAGDEFAEFAAKTVTAVQTSIEISFVGEKPTLERFLSAVVEREASCCSHLSIELVETETGYVTKVSGDRRAIAEMTSILGAVAIPSAPVPR